MSSPDPQPARSQPPANLTGRRLGDYHLIRRLGRGGMAEVYLAEQGSLRRQVAFKVLRSTLAKEEAYVRRFHNEAQAAAALVHANIVQIYEVGCLEGIHFIAQEYVAGKNLMQLLARKGPLDVTLAVNILRQIAAALHRAGQRGVTHRDIKPENVLLATTGEVKVADFGLARVTSSDGKVDLTQVGITMGTPLFMSPEQIEGGNIDPRSDLYSLGVTAYQMLAGRPPFEGDTPLSVAVQHLNNEPKSLARWRPDLDPSLIAIIHQLLQKKPEERYQSAAQLLGDLRGLQIAGLDEQWPVEVDEWTTPEVLITSNQKAAATQRLQTVMMAETNVLPKTKEGPKRLVWPVMAWSALALPIAAAGGGLVAWLTQPTPLLDTATAAADVIERQESVGAQFDYARQLWTVAAFESVLEHFPPAESRENELYGFRAKLQLAYLLEPDNPDAAMNYYAELAAQDLDWQLRAFGMIGVANLHSRSGDRAAAARSVDGVADVLAQEEQIYTGNRQEWHARWTQRLDPALREDLSSALRSRLPDNSATRPARPLGSRPAGS